MGREGEKEKEREKEEGGSDESGWETEIILVVNELENPQATCTTCRHIHILQDHDKINVLGDGEMDASAFKSTWCFCRGPEFSFQYLYQAAPGLWWALLASVGLAIMSYAHVHYHHHTTPNIYTQSKNIKQIDFKKARRKQAICYLAGPVMLCCGDTAARPTTLVLINYYKQIYLHLKWS